MLPSLQQQAVGIIDPVAAKGECEVMADIAIPYPSQVFLTLFGLPVEDRDRLIAWKDAVINMELTATPGEVDLTPAVELFTYISEAVTKHRQSPGADLLSQVLSGDDPLDDLEGVGLGYLFVLAGLDTVTSAIGSALLELARRPDLQVHLRENAADVSVFVEEIVRLEPSAPVVLRMTTDAVTIGDVTVPSGSVVSLCLGAINRDDSDPTSVNDLVMDGKVHRHWGFGGGRTVAWARTSRGWS